MMQTRFDLFLIFLYPADGAVNVAYGYRQPVAIGFLNEAPGVFSTSFSTGPVEFSRMTVFP